MRRGIIFGHRGYDMIIEAMTENKPFVVMDGFMPTGKAHFGHKMVMDQIIWYQKQGAIVVVGIADYEAYAVRGLTWEECKKIGIEEYITSLIALGLEPENTRIYFQSECKPVKDLAFELGTKVNFSEMSAIYGFSGETHLAHTTSVATQCADILHSQLPLYGGPIPVVVPVGPDQDPHIRLTRDIATKMSMFTIEHLQDPKRNQFYLSVKGKNAPEAALKEIDRRIREKYSPSSHAVINTNIKTNNVKTNNNLFAGIIAGAAAGAFIGLFADSVSVDYLSEKSIVIRGKIPVNDLFEIINFVESTYKSQAPFEIIDGEKVRLNVFSIECPVDSSGKQYWRITLQNNVSSDALEMVIQKIRDRFRSVTDNVLLGAATGGMIGGIGGGLLDLANQNTNPNVSATSPITKLSKEHIDIFVNIDKKELEQIVNFVEYIHGGYAFMSPASTYHRFMSGLTGGKMSSSIPDSNIALSEEPKAAAQKIMRAKTGGRESADEQRKLGGEFDKCSVYELCLFHLVDDDAELVRIQNDCISGSILCGECKKKAAEKMEAFLTDFGKKRKEAYNKLPLFGIHYSKSEKI